MYRAPTVEKAFQILEILSASDQGLTISDLFRASGISKSTVHGITAALEDAGAVVRDAGTKRYSLGLTLFELGRAVYSRIALKDVARPFMEDLMARTRESVFVGTRSGDHISILDLVESTQDLKITAPIGTRIPLLAGATGKVFLASMPQDRAAKLIRSLGLRRHTERSITDPEQYLEELEKVRTDGYATDDEEYISGVRAVASPIMGSGRQMSAIWVVGFTPSMSAGKMTVIAKETKLAAEAITNAG